MEALDLQDAMYEAFVADSTLCSLLDITDEDLCDSKIRRSFQDPTVLDKDMLDFFDFGFLNTRATGNYLVNHGYLEFNVYSASRANAKLIKKSIDRVLKANFRDVEISNEGQIATLPFVYGYRIIYKPLVGS
jgi:hypothetical protein